MHTSREEQLEYVKLYQESGISQTEFCRQMGLVYSTFRTWLASEASEKKNDTLLVQANIIQDKLPPANHPLVVHLKSATLEIMPGFPENELKKIIGILEG